MLTVAFIPSIYKFDTNTLKKNFKIFNIIINGYILYLLFTFFIGNHIGERYFGVMGDSFAWVLSIFCFYEYVNKKWVLFGVYLLILIFVCGSLSAFIFLIFSILFFQIQKGGQLLEIIKPISALLILVFITFLISPNILTNNAYLARFQIGGKSDYNRSEKLRSASFLINLQQSKKSFFVPQGTGSSSFEASQISTSNDKMPNDINYQIASLPTLEIFRVIREQGVYGLFIYLSFIIPLLKFIYRYKFNSKQKEFQSLSYYFFIFIVFNMILFLPGSILLFTFVIFLSFYIKNIDNYYSENSN